MNLFDDSTLTTDVTEATVKKCFELGLKADFQFTPAAGGGGEIKPLNDCNGITNKNTGVYESHLIVSCQMICISKSIY